jgi:hypothetical protein
MRWTSTQIMSEAQSFWSVLIHGGSAVNKDSIDDIRQAMLDEMTTAGVCESSTVHLRVTYASDLQDLWYMRGDVLAAISTLQGELCARQKLERISNSFKGRLPKGLVSRPSPLGF